MAGFPFLVAGAMAVFFMVSRMEPAGAVGGGAGRWDSTDGFLVGTAWAGIGDPERAERFLLNCFLAVE